MTWKYDEKQTFEKNNNGHTLGEKNAKTEIFWDGPIKVHLGRPFFVTVSLKHWYNSQDTISTSATYRFEGTTLDTRNIDASAYSAVYTLQI